MFRATRVSVCKIYRVAERCVVVKMFPEPNASIPYQHF